MKKGTTMSEETKKKLSLSQKAAWEIRKANKKMSKNETPKKKGILESIFQIFKR